MESADESHCECQQRRQQETRLRQDARPPRPPPPLKVGLRRGAGPPHRLPGRHRDRARVRGQLGVKRLLRRLLILVT